MLSPWDGGMDSGMNGIGYAKCPAPPTQHDGRKTRLRQATHAKASGCRIPICLSPKKVGHKAKRPTLWVVLKGFAVRGLDPGAMGCSFTAARPFAPSGEAPRSWALGGGG